MAQESVIKNKVKLKLANEGYVFWSAAKAMYQSSDIFGVFDCIAAKRDSVNELRFIQYTSFKNMGARRRKIKQFFITNNLFIDSELWGYDNGQFKIEKVNNPLL
jgi:hypothetical protein